MIRFMLAILSGVGVYLALVHFGIRLGHLDGRTVAAIAVGVVAFARMRR